MTELYFYVFTFCRTDVDFSINHSYNVCREHSDGSVQCYVASPITNVDATLMQCPFLSSFPHLADDNEEQTFLTNYIFHGKIYYRKNPPVRHNIMYLLMYVYVGMCSVCRIKKSGYFRQI